MQEKYGKAARSKEHLSSDYLFEKRFICLK